MHGRVRALSWARQVSQLLWESVAAVGGRKDSEPVTKKQRRHTPEQIIRKLAETTS